MESTYRVILDSISDGVFTVDPSLRILSFNRAAERITGISGDRAVGRPCFEVFRASVCETHCPLQETLETLSPCVNRPVYIYRADRRKIPISVTTTILRDEAGEFKGAVETFRDLSVVHTLQKALARQQGLDDIVSRSRRMQELFGILPQIAESDCTVLIEGASGTGKELLARAVHHHSRNQKGPFVPVNCGALPDSLIESELFGYKAGAFTDAKRDRPGRFAAAEGGTLFLDEIGDISPAVQIRLLRVLEERRFTPLGSTQAIPAHVRVIAATHRDLWKRVEDGVFREDLYYRIHVIKVSLPPLCERAEDIPLLVEHFLQRANTRTGKAVLGISHEALAALILYHWPGNIRELENAVEHGFVLCRSGQIIDLQHLPRHILTFRDATRGPPDLTLAGIEKWAIELALSRHDGRRARAAGDLGIDGSTLRRKIKTYGISRSCGKTSGKEG